MRMESACALTIVGMPRPATSAEPAVLLMSARRDRLRYMTLFLRAKCLTGPRGSPLILPGRRALAAIVLSNYGRLTQWRCPAEISGTAHECENCRRPAIERN